MRALRRAFYRLTDRIKEGALLTWLALPRLKSMKKTKHASPIIVAMTSYPARIKRSWIAIETLLRQTCPVDKFVLVLADDEFPGRLLPRKIIRQQNRGLEILWVSRNGCSFDKLIPVRLAYPSANIITVDDDKFFPRNLVQELVKAHRQFPQDIIGARGWVMSTSSASDGVHYGEGWTRADPGHRGRDLFMPGGNGCLYPPRSLNEAVDDLDQALSVCPTADDIWFWGHAQRNMTTMRCLGFPAHRIVRNGVGEPSLSSINESENNHQFQKIMDSLGIRESVLDGIRFGEVDNEG